VAKGIVESSIQSKGTGPQSAVGKLLSATIKLLNQPQIMDAIAQAAAAEDPDDQISKLAQSIINGLDDKALGRIPPAAISEFAIELVETLANLVNAAREEDDGERGPRVMRKLLEDSVQIASSDLNRASGGGQPAPEQMPPGQMQQPVSEGAA
jgi:hypothetical protein